ncbi:Leucine-rich repeat/Leucine rich repeat/Leucine Rich repeat, putative [Angomonas deanei]|uniref:Leucine-rich repeat/Leucine rich repeat/Leucine Rich repeat, putative n=1 Tax=Angomonas deanei TaxID=59799 RepID=A0A7G2CLJ6_9TRYP|nr:Leucine-rich repeat/Leucine rich repeat/Leucine Rich repeat, putative [Angomonas deanei]
MFVLYMVNTIEELDSVAVSEEQRTAANQLFEKKCIYYSARINSAEKYYNVLWTKLAQAVRERSKTTHAAMGELTDCLRPIAAELEERKCYGSGSLFPAEGEFTTENLEKVKSSLQRAIGTREVEMQNLHNRCTDVYRQTHPLQTCYTARMALELQTGGSVRLEEGSPALDKWYQQAVEAVTAQFDADRFKKYNIERMECDKVYSFVNHGLQLRFDHTAAGLNIDLASEEMLQNFACLCVPSPADPDLEEPVVLHLLGSGFQPSLQGDKKVEEHLRLADTSVGFPLCNSLFVAQGARLEELKRSKTSVNGMRGKVVLCRAYIGSCEEEKSTTTDLLGDTFRKENFPSHILSVCKKGVKEEAAWHVLDRSLVIPEFLVEFRYVEAGATPPVSVSDVDVFQQLMTEQLSDIPQEEWMDLRHYATPLLDALLWCGEENIFDQMSSEETSASCEMAEPHVAAARTALSAMEINGPFSSSVLAQYTEGVKSTVEQLSHVFLFDRKITEFPKGLDVRLPSLVTLDLARNKISSLNWTALCDLAPNLTHFCVADNDLKSLVLEAAVFEKLASLNISSNLIDSLEAFSFFDEHFPVLESLHVEDNPVLSRCEKGELALFAKLQKSIDGTLKEVNGYKWYLESQQSRPRELLQRTFDMSETSVETGDAVTPITIQYIALIAYNLAMSGSAHYNYDAYSLQQEMVPVRFFEYAVSTIEAMEKSERNKTMVSTIIKAIQTDLTMANPSRPRSSSMSMHSPTSAKNVWRSSLDLVNTFCLPNSLLDQMECVASLKNLQYVCLSHNCIADMTPVLQLSKVKYMDLQGNCIRHIPDLGGLTCLEVLNLSFNEISTVQTMGDVPHLQTLNVNGNKIDTIDGCGDIMMRLKELHIAFNQLSTPAEFYGMRESTTLIVLDVTGNPMNVTEGQTEVRLYFLFHFKNLKLLNGLPIALAEVQKAAGEFAGRMSSDLLSERANTPQQEWASLKDLDLSRCALKEAAMLTQFPALNVLILHHNSFASLDTLPAFRNLKALNLAFNRLGSSPLSNTPIGQALSKLPVLESLSLESNLITDLTRHELNLPSLLFLNLRGNEIQNLDRSLDRLPALHELLLDRNKLKTFGPNAFNGTPRLTVLSASENTLRSIEGVSRLSKLKSLDISLNRIADTNALLVELENSSVSALNCQGNPVARKAQYRYTVVGGLPSLKVLDKQNVSQAERENAVVTQTVVPEYVVPANIVMDLSDGIGGLGISPLPSAQMRLMPMQAGPPPGRGRGRGARRM